MKSLTLFTNNTLSSNNMNAIKGGTSTNINVVNIETMVEITTTNISTGTTDMLYCDRRRKKVNC
jgi:hypothetical protein